MSLSEVRRGEVWLVALGAARKGEPGKTRPTVVVSSDRLRAQAPDDVLVVVPLSSSSAPSRLRPALAAGEGTERESRAICAAIRGVAASRLLRRLGAVAPRTLADIDLALVTTLGLDTTTQTASSAGT